MFKDEIWVPIPNHESYIISSYGRVVSLTKRPHCKSKYLKPFKKGKYLSVNILGRTKSIHKLVASVFVSNPNPADYGVVKHKDGNRINNKYSNLEWQPRTTN